MQTTPGGVPPGTRLEILSFACTRCGNCCREPGYVRLCEGECEQIAGHLGMEVRAFTAEFTRLTDDRACLSLIEKGDGSCIFLDTDQTCRLQAVKPRQCREFPMVWRYAGFEQSCPGVVVARR